MGYALRALIVLVLLAFAGGVSERAWAQSVKKPGASSDKDKAAAKAAAEKKAAEEAQKAYAAGSRAYESGKSEQAIQLLTTALRGGGLPTVQMARALYLRGLAYRKSGKPGLAISDLTSALWLKNGLSETDRADATAKRSEAYREAGLDEQGRSPDHVVAGNATEAAKPAPKAASQSSGGGLFPWLTGGGSPSAEPKPAPAPAAAPAPASTPNKSAWETATLSSAVSSTTTSRTASDIPQPMLSSGPAPTPAAAPSPPPAAAPSSGSSNTLFGAIGSMFSSGSSSSAAAPSPETTASTGHVSAVSSWSDSTEVTVGRAGKSAASHTQVAAAAKPAPPAAPQFTGKFRLQVAAVRSKEEARELANKLEQNHGPSLEGRTPSVDEAVLGTMGTFYRVRVGPYADAGEPRKLCSALKADGFDCLIVSK